MSKSTKLCLRKILDKIFILLAKITKTNLIFVGYYQKGIMKHGNDEISGEKFVIEKILKDKIIDKKPTFFDVGSNIGEYSLSLKKQFPNSTIYSFEPNPNTYSKIPPKTLVENINFYNTGLGSTPGNSIIYDYKKLEGTQHASIYKEVLTEIHHSKNVEGINFTNETLDNFCRINNILKINFLKLDTEGSEFDVLKGSEGMLKNNKIDIIQFEFNEMNIISRVFLKDYYNTLNNYDIYRIDSNRLIPLPIYKTENEIFKYQNFLAINKYLK